MDTFPKILTLILFITWLTILAQTGTGQSEQPTTPACTNCTTQLQQV